MTVFCRSLLRKRYHIGTAAHSPPNDAPHQLLGGAVHRRHGLVQNQAGRVAQQGAGEADALPLARREQRAVPADLGAVLAGQRLDEVVDLARRRRRRQLLVGGTLVAVAQVLLDGHGEDQGVLVHHGEDLAAQPARTQLTQVGAVQQDAALSRPVERREQVRGGALAHAVGSDDGHDLAGLDPEADVAQDGGLGAVVVAEGHVLELEFASHGVQLPALILGVLQVMDFVNAVERDGGLGHLRCDLTTTGYAQAEERTVQNEGGEVAHGDVTGLHLVGPAVEHHQGRQVEAGQNGAHEDALRVADALGDGVAAVEGVGERLDFVGLLAEVHHALDTVDHLVGLPDGRIQQLLPLALRALDDRGIPDDEEAEEGDAGHGDGVVQQFGDEQAGGPGVEKGGALHQQLSEHLLARALLDQVDCVVHFGDAEPGGNAARRIEGQCGAEERLEHGEWAVDGGGCLTSQSGCAARRHGAPGSGVLDLSGASGVDDCADDSRIEHVGGRVHDHSAASDEQARLLLGLEFGKEAADCIADGDFTGFSRLRLRRRAYGKMRKVGYIGVGKTDASAKEASLGNGVWGWHLGIDIKHYCRNSSKDVESRLREIVDGHIAVPPPQELRLDARVEASGAMVRRVRRGWSVVGIPGLSPGTQEEDHLRHLGGAGTKVSAEESRHLEREALLEEIFAEAFMMAPEVTDGSLQQRRAFSRLVTNVAATFDVDGYRWMLGIIKGRRATERFAQAVAHPNFSQPHCDKGSWVSPSHTFGTSAKFPGGPFRGGTGYDLVKWMGNLYTHAHTPASVEQPGLQNMIVQSFQQIKGVIQSILAVVVDFVPPMIITMSLPCLPMLTGINCLGSVLYPISATDFTMADVTDSVMNGVISSFPAKYAAKVGHTSDAQYYLCATVYLGMYCASLFPICVTGAAKVTETFPLCFVQCLATLIACPGFWMDDIAIPCSNLSMPPFCSFSAFINHWRVPPQHTTYDQSHQYPEGCPGYDPEMADTPMDLYDKKKAPDSAIARAAKEKPLEAFHLKRPPAREGFEGACDCAAIKDVCKLHLPYPVYVNADRVTAETHYQVPERIGEQERRCCEECKPIWDILENDSL
ncbi:hipothetical protein [Babesia caballi]|uniref:Hipothetical protein n=1 Tax=Babesia caballi TaxID=5871 RepID=A0AAV4M1X6_BABCB|nr:hipothetical protein [Babesia caballi]